MDEILTVLRYTDLLNLYQNLLSETQKEILIDYFCYNLSFSEIAENRKITRSAVEDAIKKGKKKLDYYEEQLCSLKAINMIHDLKEESDSQNTKGKLDEIERVMKHGI